MRFFSDGVNFPDELLWVQDEGRVIFICGPLGVASFVPINEQISLAPYGLKLTGCERLGQRLACFGEIGYEGPSHKARIESVKLTDGKNRQYKPSFMRFGARTDNGSNSYPNLKTGVVSFEVEFWATPIFDDFVLSGTIADIPFEFASFSTNENDQDAGERLNYFWSWPPRVELGSSIRLGDFKVSPTKCERIEFSATCELKILYIGPPSTIKFDAVSLVDHMGNYYSPTLLQIAGREDSGTNTLAKLHAGEFALKASFDSLPKSRLFELEARIDERIHFDVTNISLPSPEGAMGLPSDIQYTTIDHQGVTGPINVHTHGCARRSTELICYLQIDYSGPVGSIRISGIELSTGLQDILSATTIQVSNRYDNGKVTSPFLQTGTYPMRIKFEGVSEGANVSFTMKAGDGSAYSWSEKIK